MLKQTSILNEEVTRFVDGLEHPLQKEITQLRQAVLNANTELTENIKWNGPNYCLNGEDRITMRIQPPKQIQLVFHRGAKVLAQPGEKLITDNSGLLTWKTNDRAVATFKSVENILASKPVLTKLINEWLVAGR